MADLMFMTDTEKTFQYSKDLPSLPIPPLHHTLQRYLDSVRPLVSDKEYEETVKIVDRFEHGIGKELNLKLHERAKYMRNWLSKWWEDVAYLEFRESIAVRQNISGVGPYMYDVWPACVGSQMERAALMLHYTMDFWRNIRKERIQPQKDSKGRHLCMNQFYYMYNTYRVPGLHKDELLHYFKTESQGDTPSNVIVTYKGRLFSVESLDDKGELLTAPEFQQILQTIHDRCNSEPHGQCVSVLTADNRTRWAQMRNRIIALHPKNYETLEIIQKAAFLIGLSDDSPANESELAWRGFGDSPENKWFDKSVNIVVFKNGLVVSGCDHSPCDAMVFVVSTFYLHLMLRECNGKWNGSHTIRTLPPVEELKFHIDDQIARHIDLVRDEFQKEADNLEAVTTHFRNYGKAYLKTVRIHPDTHVQLAMQYAYYKKYRRPAATYESATTRIFYNARTETVRSCTVEAQDWCKSMVDPKASAQRRVQLFLRATDKHNTLMQEAQELKGCDRHLLGLYLISRENNLDVPELYMDPSFIKSGGAGNFVISSSFVGFTTVYGGVAPMCKDGYGIIYRIQDDEIVFYLSAWKSDEETDAREMERMLHDCLDEMRLLIDNHHITSARL
ncbi:peroxisomal carnitine O-octanoyltransferase-like [Gigantopelta aegis]|uniref:peroxisomal carnitine O-octanoyltransferase-like n=1 Tax=Gigantopelta aegis TaxID=1735272 RepID=UPI001B888035|nr:peroxisomal carnitine O-octanoyltransferase-like [Gigantopelta aegis]